MDFAVTLPNEIIPALSIAITVIMVDVSLGIALNVVNKTFDFDKLPKFLLTGVLPSVGGLLVLGLAAHFVGVFFTVIFYFAASAVVAKYVKDIKTKVVLLFVSNK
jgi:hypothetical protein